MVEIHARGRFGGDRVIVTHMAKAIRAKVGDVFRIPISTDQYVLGQVVKKVRAQHMVVTFRAANASIDDAIASGIELAGIVFDAKLRNGDWPIVENRPPVEVKDPWFALGHEGLENLRLTNFDDSEVRLVSPSEASKHRHRNLSGPMVLQRAVAALHGNDSWQSDFDHFRDLASEVS